MSKSILYVGLDVDDKAFHGSAYSLETGEIFEFKSKPTFGALMKKLEKLGLKGYKLDVCYEASYTGYSLCRDLRSSDIACNIIAPSLIPDMAGKKVKTDRVDSLKLAEYYAKGLLTPIHIPDETDEEIRDLIRTRSFLVKQRKGLKTHILSTCRRYKLNYREAVDSTRAHYWTKIHMNWLTDKINHMESSYLKKTFEVLLFELERLDEGISDLDRTIEEVASTERYKVKVDALNCFRGLATLSSMTLLTEIDDIRRFNHPKPLVSYLGLDIREYTSGGKERKGGITKMGNKRVRTVLVEACQNPFSVPKVSNCLRKDRDGVDARILSIADRCAERLRKKASSMYHAGKHKNKIKTACAREMVGFIWETLMAVA